MSLLPLLAIVLAVAALLSWVNHRFVRLPTTIGVMLIALAMSLALVLLDFVSVPLRDAVEARTRITPRPPIERG